MDLTAAMKDFVENLFALYVTPTHELRNKEELQMVLMINKQAVIDSHLFTSPAEDTDAIISEYFDIRGWS